MNKTCLKVLEALHAIRPHDGRVFLSKYGLDLNNPRKWFELTIEAAKVSMVSP